MTNPRKEGNALAENNLSFANLNLVCWTGSVDGSNSTRSEIQKHSIQLRVVGECY